MLNLTRQARQTRPPTRWEVIASDRFLQAVNVAPEGVRVLFNVGAIVGTVATTITGAVALDGNGTTAIVAACSVAFTAALYYLSFLSHGNICRERPETISDLAVAWRISRRLRRAHRRFRAHCRRLDRQQGWRPREGAPHPAGRTDLHDRYVLDSRATATDISVALMRWSYCDDEGWQPQGHVADTRRTFGSDDIDQLTEYTTELTEKAAELTSADAQQYVQHRHSLALNERIAAAINATTPI
jgi:hypothetical protein